jgi:hypothetical protein
MLFDVRISRIDVSKARSGYVWTVGDGQYGCLGHGRCGSGVTLFNPLPLAFEAPVEEGEMVLPKGNAIKKLTQRPENQVIVFYNKPCT